MFDGRGVCVCVMQNFIYTMEYYTDNMKFWNAINELTCIWHIVVACQK